MLDELLCVLDKSGGVTKETASETAVHQKGLWHGWVNLCITDRRGAILLVRRGVPPYVHILPGSWDFPVGGHVRTGELPAEAVWRGMHLLGVRIPRSELKQRGLRLVGTTRSEYKVADGRYPGGRYMHRVVEYNFVLPWPLFDRKTLQPDGMEISQVRWHAIGKVRQEQADAEKLGSFGYVSRGPEQLKLYGMMLDAAQKLTVQHAGR